MSIKIIDDTSTVKSIFLDQTQTAILTVSSLPNNILSNIDFNEIFNMCPKEDSAVIVSGRPVNVFRHYKTFGVVPRYNPDWNHTHHFSYMYDNGSGDCIKDTIPDIFIPIMEYLNIDRNEKYNHVIVNWYETAEDYIAYHRDCTIGMNDNADVSVVTLLEDRDYPRDFGIKTKKGCIYDQVKVKTNHGSIITMNHEAIVKFLHGVPKVPYGTTSRRISMSFRSFKV
jgi:hypothetical protein